MKLASETRPDKKFPFASYKAEEEEADPSVLYPRIATKIERDYNRLFFEGVMAKGPEHEGVDYERSGASPFRYHLAHIFSEISKINLPPDLEEEISDLGIIAEHSINGVITTNYDGFLENIFPKYDVYIGQEDLLFSQSTGIYEIYKIHGSYIDPGSLVFTEADYVGFEKRKAYLTAKLLSIFMENPVIFLGYSASDSNILGIFESIANCLSVEHLMQLGRRIIFLDYNADQDETTVAAGLMHLDGKNMSYTHIITNSYIPIFKRLLKIKRNYDPRLLRRLKKDVYNTIKANDAVDTVKVISDGDFFDENYQFKHNALVGLSISGHSGHNVLKSEEIYRNVILQNCDIDCKSFVESWLPEHLKMCQYPVFYYVALYQAQYPSAKLPVIVAEFISANSSFDAISGTRIRSRRAKRRYNKLKEIIDDWVNIKNRYEKIMLLDEDELNRGRLKDFLKELIMHDPECLRKSAVYISDLRRLIRLCDYLENAAAVSVKGDGSAKSLEIGASTEHHDKASSDGRNDPTGAPSGGIIS